MNKLLKIFFVVAFALGMSACEKEEDPRIEGTISYEVDGKIYQHNLRTISNQIDEGSLRRIQCSLVGTKTKNYSTALFFNFDEEGKRNYLNEKGLIKANSILSASSKCGKDSVIAHIIPNETAVCFDTSLEGESCAYVGSEYALTPETDEKGYFKVLKHTETEFECEFQTLLIPNLCPKNAPQSSNKILRKGKISLRLVK